MSRFKASFDEADRLFSLFIRTRDDWTCQRCRRVFEVNCGVLLQNSHFWSRGNESVRFDPENCDALCSGCHDFFGRDREAYRAWKISRLGQQRFNALMVKANAYAKKDRKMARLVARAALRQVCSEKGIPYLG